MDLRKQSQRWRNKLRKQRDDDYGRHSDFGSATEGLLLSPLSLRLAELLAAAVWLTPAPGLADLAPTLHSDSASATEAPVCG